LSRNEREIRGRKNRKRYWYPADTSFLAVKRALKGKILPESPSEIEELLAHSLKRGSGGALLRDFRPLTLLLIRGNRFRRRFNMDDHLIGEMNDLDILFPGLFEHVGDFLM
jgi:hypothetical protein